MPFGRLRRGEILCNKKKGEPNHDVAEDKGVLIMLKTILRRFAGGFMAGVTLNSIICFASSYGLRLGYYAPCFVGLTEPLGGELNAALVQAGAFGIAGSVAALGIKVLARRVVRAKITRQVSARRGGWGENTPAPRKSAAL